MIGFGFGLRRQARLLALLAVLAAAAAGLDHETMLCANDNTPICARTHTEYLLFKNECDLRNAQRGGLMDGPLFDVALYYCVPGCDFECDGLPQPVCGVSVASGERKSFRNRCEMMRTSCLSKSDWLVHKWGMCPAGQRPEPTQAAAHTVLVGRRKRRRPVPCTNVYRPVCASYAGVKSTFSNECLVNAENIRTGRNWRIISEGLCGEDSIKMKHNRKWKPKTKPKVHMERSKRSHKQLNQLDDFELPEDAVQIFAPSTFHTQFISNSGTMEKSYSLPARKPHQATRPKSTRFYGNPTKKRPGDGGKVQSPAQPQSTIRESPKPCVFSNEPVCGSFNGESRTFASVCALMEYSQTVGNAWTILYEGSCRRCDKPCPTVYSPICVNRNGISYTIINECYLERVRCKDPNSDWKITHKGECALPAEEVAQSIPTPPSPKPLSRIPHLLYASRPTTTTARPSRTDIASAATTATPAPRRLMKRPKRPTATPKPRPRPRPTHRPTTTPTMKDLSNRKIRKIELSNFSAFDGKMSGKETQPIKAPVTTKLWSSKDSWLAHQSLDHGHAKDQFHKRPHFKKAHSENYPQYQWPHALLPSTTGQPSTSTTGPTPAPVNTLEGIAELINFDLKSAGEIFGEIEADTEILFMMDTTATTAKASETAATTSAGTTVATTDETTEESTEPTTTTPATTTTIATTPTTQFAHISSEETTEFTAETDTDESTTNIPSSSTLIDDVTSELGLDQSTADETAETATTTTITTDLSEKSTTPNLDYMSDDPSVPQSEQTSIYGLDKNSLIMRLLRARSGKNMVL